MFSARYWECTKCSHILHFKMANLYFMNLTFLMTIDMKPLRGILGWESKCLLGNKTGTFLSQKSQRWKNIRESKRVITAAREPEVTDLRGQSGIWLQHPVPSEEDTEAQAAGWTRTDHHSFPGFPSDMSTGFWGSAPYRLKDSAAQRVPVLAHSAPQL